MLERVETPTASYAPIQPPRAKDVKLASLWCPCTIATQSCIFDHNFLSCIKVPSSGACIGIIFYDVICYVSKPDGKQFQQGL